MIAIAISLMLGAALVGFMPDLDTSATNGPDKNTGSAEDDYIDGASGDDLLVGQDGDDTLAGNTGDDWLLGLDGNDALIGGQGDDVIIGGRGHDVFDAGFGDDFVEAANLIDEEQLKSSLSTASNFNEIDFQYDLPKASDAGDDVNLGAGNDTAVIGSNDTLISGSGLDEIVVGDWIEPGSEALIKDFESEEDLLVYSHSASEPEPDLTLYYDKATSTTELRADGRTVARLDDPFQEIGMKSVVVTAYA